MTNTGNTEIVNLTEPYFAGSDTRYAIHTNRLKELLGLPRKLPTTAVPVQKVGNTFVFVLSADEAQRMNPRACRPHRVMAICNDCHTPVPAGRLSQHRKVHK